MDYDLRTSYHYRCTLLIAIFLSIAALMSAGIRAFINYENPWLVGIFSVSSMIILVFWVALRQGIEARWEPALFADLGFQGIIALIRYTQQAKRKNIIWLELKKISETLDLLKSVAIHVVRAVTKSAVLLILLSIVTFANPDGFLSFIPLFVIIFAAFPLIINVFIIIVFAFVSSIVFIIIAATSIAALQVLKDKPGKPWLYVVGWLAFPWFCWLPITSVLSTWALYDFLAQVSPFTLPLWQQTALGVAVVAGLWATLWHRGLWLEAKARNPFHGGPLGAALGVKR